MLPTLAVILWAYGMYALIRAWSRRKNGHYLYRSRGRRYALLALMVGSGAALGLVLWLSLAAEQPEHGLKLAGFLGTVWAESRPENAGSRGEVPQIKGQTAGGQPVYALLHPETPAGQLDAEKAKSAPRRLQKPKTRKPASVVQVKNPRPPLSVQKKDKLPVRSQPKKKKPAAAAAAPIASGG